MTQSNSYGQWPRRLLEGGFFAAVIGTLWTLDTLTKIKERNLQGGGFAEFQLYAHQITSALAALILIPAVAWWLNRFPLRRDRLASAIIAAYRYYRRQEASAVNAKPDRLIVQTGSGETIIRQQDIVRTHRSYLVNIDRIEEIRSADSGGHEIRMRSGKRIPLSRGYREKFKSEITS